ncbi:CPI_1c_G0047840.mRNA.1.CDS.1 [Saccharomyces cerevisiae]|nr:CPI_1c_G0047840.mRNA.1.CDS.1 [Saccharomyces cerevisiae]CAI7453297.1 CPI_1c_G0047840.mRNA.1.CDS.1 [Saccharomyces cerevisiae]
MKAKDKYKGQTKNKVKSVDMMYLALRRRKNEFTQLHNHADSVADPRSCRPGDNAGREAVPGGVFCACNFQGLPCAKGRDWRSNKNAGWGCDDDDHHDNWCHYLSCRKNLSAFATWVY